MVQVIQLKDNAVWDNYVTGHPMANAYHFSQWQKIITNAYGYKAYNLAVVNSDPSGRPSGTIRGLLPLVHLKNPIFGNRLVSMPFFDHGGIIADNPGYAEQLLLAAVALGEKLKAQHIELRHLDKISCLQEDFTIGQDNCKKNAACRKPLTIKWSLRSHKVRLLLSLPDSSEALMKSFKSKLRSQINRPIKAGLTAIIGGMDLLDDFYNVFCINMRDLGSPVHAKKLPQSVLANFPGNARIAVVYKAGAPIAAAFMVGCNKVLINPWASALRNYSQDSPNMLLYWTMLAYAADHGFRQFDFGRSTPEEGTYRFKTQWGAKPHPMYWYTIWVDQTKSADIGDETSPESRKKAIAVALWQKLPVSVSRMIGPHIRKHIDL